MKKFGNYLRNVAQKKKHRVKRKRNPFALTAVNPARKKARRAKPIRRKRRKNPLEIQHVIAAVPSRNPSRRKKRRKSSAKSTRNPPMSKKRKRRSKRSRNPVSHKRRRSSRRRSRNPIGRRRRNGRMVRRRNPIAIVNDVITRENIETGLGVLTGVVGTRWLVNKLIQGDPVTGVRMFDLPGVTYSTAAAPLTQAQFSAKNKWALAFYEAAAPAFLGWLLRNKAQSFSKGLLQSTIVNVGIAAVRSTQIGQQAGLNAFLPRGRGINTFIPGVPPMLSGPATAFINNGSPVPNRNGMNAVVDARWHNQTVMGGANPFKK